MLRKRGIWEILAALVIHLWFRHRFKHVRFSTAGIGVRGSAIQGERRKRGQGAHGSGQVPVLVCAEKPKIELAEEAIYDFAALFDSSDDSAGTVH